MLRGSRYVAGPLAGTWRRWAGEVEETVFYCGHFIAEEEPEGCADALLQFFNPGD